MDVFTITELNLYIKSLIENDRLLSNVTVKGEISNFKHHSSGHMYLSLKDDGGVIRAVMFRYSAQKLKFRPENGMQVVVSGKVSVYERDGQYQIYIEDMMPDGVGALYVAYEQLKAQLEQEGLFSPEYKKPIPKYPETIGIVTSPTGAAIRDILNILKRRFPYTRVYLYPALVQGEGAAESIVKGLRFFDGKVDTVITGRGGGSIEDLWAFNEEAVARQIFAMKTPVISAVGHETDFTIADFVADRRVPTPSAAAEISVPSGSELQKFLKIVDGRLYSALLGKLESSQKELKRLLEREVLRNPLAVYDVKRMQIDSYTMQLENIYRKEIHTLRERFVKNVSKLDALSPLKILERGYSVTEDKSGNPVSSVKAFQAGDPLCVTLTDGKVHCNVVDVKPKEKTGEE
ncbi:MAG: exodeoxyribonuclease VII large subunit [Clostridia bacterium]|nr:exodeoxyribonuclease VII large subunit [Clostridia bacterium]